MKIKNLKLDYSLLFVVLSLVIFGIIMVYSTSFYKFIIIGQNTEQLLYSGTVYAIIGFVVMMIAIFFNYQHYRKLILLIAIVAVVASVLVLFYGVKSGGATRWLVVPIVNIAFMPSELTKISLIFIAAYFIDGAGKRVKEFRHFFIMMMIILAFAGLTALQKDLSTSSMMLVLVLLMMFVGGANIFYLISLGVIGGGVFKIYLSIFPYSMRRINIWLSTLQDRTYTYADKNYQIIHSLYAVGSGGLFGKGLGKGELKFLRLPEANTDFIFAIICEELGFLGAILVLLAFIFIIYRIFKIAVAAPDKFGFCIASGVGILIALHTVINIGVVINLLPTTGITLPFISKGGSSLIMLMFLVGVVLNISLQSQHKELIE